MSIRSSLRNLFTKSQNVTTPSKTYYTRNHSWLKIDEEGKAKIGITEIGQMHLGDISKINDDTTQNKILSSFSQGEEIIMVKSSSGTWSDILMPVSAKLVGVNKNIKSVPLILSRAPESDGWIADVELFSSDQTDREINDLMNLEEYKKFCCQH